MLKREPWMDSASPYDDACLYLPHREADVIIPANICLSLQEPARNAVKIYKQYVDQAIEVVIWGCKCVF
jgi:hypothetical protein